MGKLKKVFILLSIVGLAFGYSLAGLTVMPEKAEAAKANGAKIVQNEAAAENEFDSEVDEGAINDGAVESGIVCEEPETDNAHVYDGGYAGVDKSFFNTQNQISGNWDGFQAGNCPIVRYKYAIWKVDASNHPVLKIVSGFVDDIESSITVDSSKFINQLEEGAKYRVKILAKARVKGATGVWSDPKWSDGQILDTIKPVIDSFSLIQDKPYGENVALSWSASDTGGSGIKSYQLYRNGVPSILDKTVLSYPDTIFGDNLTYSYYLIAIDEAGNPSSQSTTLFATVDDIAPGAPSISYWIGGGNIVIFWPAVSGAANYELYRNGVLIYSGPEVKYTDTHLTKGQTYSYTAYALDGAGNKSLASNTLQIYVPKPRVSTVATTATGGEVQGETITQGEQVSPSPSPSGEVKASETSEPEEQSEAAKKTNWSLIIAIIIAAAIVVAGVLYWWYARGDEEDEI